MLPQRSLRLRLLLVLLGPLILISVAAMWWRYAEARATAQDIFDRNLLITAFAVARDVALSGGDSLAPSTQSLLKGASGGAVFYHVYGPDGSFVTGYSLPPVTGVPDPTAELQQYDASHQGQPVRVARLLEQTEIDGISGTAVVTVWQRLEQRDAFVRQTAMQAGGTMLLLLVSVAGLVLVGVGFGLKPLTELEDAIQKRSSADLSPIARMVPVETKGIVARLNSLFSQVTDAQESQQRFVSLAAHQLRNPIAALHTLAESTVSAKTEADMKMRATALLDETRAAKRLTDQLLSLERVKGTEPDFAKINVSDLLKDTAEQFAPRAIEAGLAFDLDTEKARELTIRADLLMLSEAISNLLDNALAHGGETMKYISLSALHDRKNAIAQIVVENDGVALNRRDFGRLLERFSQGASSKGAGLGLSIAQSIIERHAGTMALEAEDPVRFCLAIPTSA